MGTSHVPPDFFKKIDFTCKSNVLVLFHENRPAIMAIICDPIYFLVDFWSIFFLYGTSVKPVVGLLQVTTGVVFRKGGSRYPLKKKNSAFESARRAELNF